MDDDGRLWFHVQVIKENLLLFIIIYFKKKLNYKQWDIEREMIYIYFWRSSVCYSNIWCFSFNKEWPKALFRVMWYKLEPFLCSLTYMVSHT